MARSLRSFPESERKAKAMFRLENCTGLSKCGAQDYFYAIYARPKAESILDGAEAMREDIAYSSYEL